MDSFKVLPAACAASIAAHVFILYSLGIPAVEGVPTSGPIPIQIDDVRYEKTPPSSKPEPAPVKPPAPPKRVKGLPVPRYEVLSPETPSSSADDQVLKEKIQKQMQQLRQLDQPQAPPPRVVSSMTSAELLNDPQKGKIFLGYFSQVKKKIQNTVYQKGKSVVGRGNVCLGFVLDEHGRLQRLAVLEKGTNADDAVRALAKQCLQASAPFGDFPKDLGPGRTAFNITIFFDSAD